MNRVVLFLVASLYTCLALAHPGHDAPEPHLHSIWEVVLLVALIAACAVILIRRTSSYRRAKKHARLRL